MNGVHDLGGMHGFGPVAWEPGAGPRPGGAAPGGPSGPAVPAPVPGDGAAGYATSRSRSASPWGAVTIASCPVSSSR